MRVAVCSRFIQLSCDSCRFFDSLTFAQMRAHSPSPQGCSYRMQARVDKERYQQALTEYQQRLTMSEAGLEESQEEPYATFQPQGQAEHPRHVHCMLQRACDCVCAHCCAGTCRPAARMH